MYSIGILAAPVEPTTRRRREAHLHPNWWNVFPAAASTNNEVDWSDEVLPYLHTIGEDCGATCKRLYGTGCEDDCNRDDGCHVGTFRGRVRDHWGK